MNKIINTRIFDKTFYEKRKQLTEILKKKGIDDQRILDAISILPREYFVSSCFQNRAYEDNALPIECKQTISQPYTVAFMTQMANIQEGDRVLEIGTGSGYQASLLYLLGANVFTIERISELYSKALNIFKQFDFNINIRLGDGSIGWKEFAPFDSIIVTAAAPKVPQVLLEQLSIGRKLVVPVGDKVSQSMYVITKINESIYDEKIIDKFKFVPLIGKEGW